MRIVPILLLLSILSLSSFAEEPLSDVAEEIVCDEEQPLEECPSAPIRKWYCALKPGYYYLTDDLMRQFHDNGGFTVRGETGCRFWGPLIVWLDAGYFQKDGHAIGGTEKIHIKLATITLGLKAIYYFHDVVAVYAGAGPRLFMMLMHNDSPFVTGEDNQVGIGGGFDGGFWIFPFVKTRNFLRDIYLDLFVDYSLKTLKIEADTISSEDFDVKVSGTTAGLGLGIRF